MLSKEGVLDSINLRVDYCMSPFSLDEHGRNLIYTNHYELCAEHGWGGFENYHDTTEWWGFVHCMYGMQDCLNYNTTQQSMDANQTCAGAESGEDDDMTLSGTDSVSNDECDCTLDGVAEYCADAHLTSMTYSELKSCAYSSYAHKLAVKSKTVAEEVNSGDPLWIKVDNMTISLSKDEASEIGVWGDQVLEATCIRIEDLGGTLPEACS